uniref:Uncharacterized protein n=1 Tax=Oncorhynchus kisutch TaxID=8019 RepID=A0A8C7H5H0_ONCKI
MKLPVLVVVSLLHLGQSCAQAAVPPARSLRDILLNGSLLTVAVGIYNSYTERTDYTCKYNCEAGFYTRGLTGPYCQYPYESTTFQILTNRDHFEYNKYGLGSYQVLAINRYAYSQHISYVKYGIDEVEIFPPPETMRISVITNNECQMVVKTVTISKTSEVESTWNIGRTTILGITTGITFSAEKTLQFNRGTTMVEAHSHSVSVELNITPNHSCNVYMEDRKFTADIPFTARLSRIYGNGEALWTSISGVYNAVQIGRIRAVVDRCEPVIDAKPCH